MLREKVKIIYMCVLCAGMVFGLTACSTKDMENNDVVNSTVDSDTVVDQVEQSLPASDKVQGRFCYFDDKNKHYRM